MVIGGYGQSLKLYIRTHLYNIDKHLQKFYLHNLNLDLRSWTCMFGLGLVFECLAQFRPLLSQCRPTGHQLPLLPSATTAASAARPWLVALASTRAWLVAMVSVNKKKKRKQFYIQVCK